VVLIAMVLARFISERVCVVPRAAEPCHRFHRPITSRHRREMQAGAITTGAVVNKKAHVR
jgi:hypothetical protein